LPENNKQTEIQQPAAPEIEQPDRPEFEQATEHPNQNDVQVLSEKVRYDNADTIIE